MNCWLRNTLIKYTLKCANDHIFDGWFQNSSSFDKQNQDDLIHCPQCGSTMVEKTLMAPTVTGTKAQKSVAMPDLSIPEISNNEPMEGNPALATIPEPLVHGDKTVQAVVEKMRELRQWVEKNTDNVGDDFANKARKMHYGEEERRGIYGKATFEEAQDLIDDGIDFLPLPALPEDNN